MLLILRVGARVSCLAALGLVATCSGPVAEDGGVDASHDAGHDAHRGDVSTPDAPSIDAPEAGNDASHDAGPRDPEWVRLPGLPDVCDLEVAMHPERIETLPWRAECGPGCLLPYGAVLTGQVDSDGTRYFVTSSILPGRESYELFDDGGTCVAAWIAEDRRPASSCALSPPVVGGGRVGITGYAFVDGHDELGVDVVWIADIGDSAGLVTPAFSRPNGASQGIEHLFVSATHFAYQSSPDGTLYLTDGTGPGQPVQVAVGDGIPQQVDLRGDHVIYEDWQPDLVRLATATRGAGALLLYGADPGDVVDFGSDGVVLAWTQAYGYDPDTLTYASLELWTAPYTTSPVAMAPRRVVVLSPGGASSQTITGGGWYVIPTADGGFDAWWLMDGTRRHWTPPAGNHTVHATQEYAAADDIFVMTLMGARRLDPAMLPIVP